MEDVIDILTGKCFEGYRGVSLKLGKSYCLSVVLQIKSGGLVFFENMLCNLHKVNYFYITIIIFRTVLRHKMKKKKHLNNCSNDSIVK